MTASFRLSSIYVTHLRIAESVDSQSSMPLAFMICWHVDRCWPSSMCGKLLVDGVVVSLASVLLFDKEDRQTVNEFPHPEPIFDILQMIALWSDSYITNLTSVLPSTEARA